MRAALKMIRVAPLFAALGTVDTAIADELAAANATPELARVEVTGSRLRRVDYEGAPLQVLTRADIDRLGVFSAEQLVGLLAVNGSGADNLSSNVGIQPGTSDRNNNGNSSANLRGLGASSTLVLLNGRRIPAHGAKGNSVDLNWIPLAAVQRVEILKDGASAVYGADAIGGVINFITRGDYEGIDAGAAGDITEAGGGDFHRAHVSIGRGALERDGFNAMVTLGVDRQQRLDGDRRDFVNGFRPERGLAPDTNGTPYATQVAADGSAIAAPFRLPASGNQTYNRANLLSFEGRCDAVPGMSQYQSALWRNPGAAFACAYDYGAAAVLIQPVERAHVLARGQWAWLPAQRLVAEFVGSRVSATKQFEPYQVTTSSAALAAARYPAGGRYYQDLSDWVPGFDANAPIAYRWRCEDCGGRTIDTRTDAWRGLLGIEGELGQSWHYRAGLSASRSAATSTLGPGYYYTAGLIEALGSGDLNLWRLPGEAQDPIGLQRLAAASAEGERLFDGVTAMTQLDASASGELAQWPAGPLALAAGFDLRRESYRFSDGSRSTQPIFQAPFDAEFPEVERDVGAAFAELAVPIATGFEASVALRHDHYSDFGDTTNPRLALSWRPLDALVLRGSYNTGFRAPSFFQLHSAQNNAPVPGNIADPVLCPAGNVPGADLTVCAIRPDARQGGNPGLQPEESRQWSIGFVASPSAWANVSVDVWTIARRGLIVELTPQEVIANHTTFPENLVRGSNGRLDGPGGYIRSGFVNADGDRTRGADVGIEFNGDWRGGRWIAALDGSYVDSHRVRIFATQPFVEQAGRWNARTLQLRWKHLARLGYTRGHWNTTLTHQYASGYDDEVPPGTVPPGFEREVDAYSVFGLSASYGGFDGVTLTAGIRNLFDTDPPFTAHNLDFAAGAGWDPRVADPRGRSYTLNVQYQFR
jgi:iron complex outermembrane receptor protein